MSASQQYFNLKCWQKRISQTRKTSYRHAPAADCIKIVWKHLCFQCSFGGLTTKSEWNTNCSLTEFCYTESHQGRPGTASSQQVLHTSVPCRSKGTAKSLPQLQHSLSTGQPVAITGQGCPSPGGSALRASCCFQFKRHQHASIHSIRNTSDSTPYRCCPLSTAFQHSYSQHNRSNKQGPAAFSCRASCHNESSTRYRQKGTPVTDG